MKSKETRSRQMRSRQTSQIMLSEKEHEIVTAQLPKGYSLVTRNDLTNYLRHKAKKEKQLSKAKKETKKAEQASQQSIIESKESIQVPVPLVAAIDEQNFEVKNKDSIQLQQQAKLIIDVSQTQSAHKPENIPQQQYQPISSHKSESTVQKSFSSIVSKMIREMVAHPTFGLIYASRKQNPAIQRQISKLKAKLKGQYSFSSFKSDINQLLSMFLELGGDNQEIKSFQNLINTKIAQCDEQFEQIGNEKKKNKEKVRVEANESRQIQGQIQRNQRKKPKKEGSETEEDRSEEEFQPPLAKKEKKEEKLSKQSVRQDSGYSSEESLHLPKRKGRSKHNVIPPRPKNSHVTLSDTASLGFNIGKLQSKDLQTICYTFFPRQIEKSSSDIYTIDLQSMPKLHFFQLQAYVKNLLKSRSIPYIVLVQSDEDDFIIEDDD